MFSLLVVIGLSVQSAGRLSERSIRRHFLSELTVPNGMTWGSWGYKDTCPTGTYAAGFGLRVEKPSHVLDDDTALNGIRLHCVNLSKGLSHPHEGYVTVQSGVGHWGEWTKIKWCPFGFLTTFQLRVESSQGIKDDTAANNISSISWKWKNMTWKRQSHVSSLLSYHELKLVFSVDFCSQFSVSTGRRSERSISRHYRSLLNVPNGMYWGSWSHIDMCPRGTYAAGFSLKVDKPSMGIRDSKGLTGIHLHCINPLRASLNLYEDYSSVLSEAGRFKCSRGSELEGRGTSWGEWGGWSQTCEGGGISGIMTRIEEPQGNGDDTALNDVIMFCCD
ncbi:vitelline membrane outer layer protein 1 homolog [Garra rufa]|uniref:vitelline membrane outer layer protein 1 homolog n=1 Tax=Garra rufa TaxID=137080 RepID=UPI003CCEDB7F